MTTGVPLVARKTITTIQEGSRYKERYTLAMALPDGTTVRQEFRDSAGGLITEITGTVNGHYVEFENPYTDVEQVPNGAGFNCFACVDPDTPDEEDLLRYGTVFRRQLFFPDSPATLAATTPKRYEDTFQRPAGSVGGRWKILVGRPTIQDNGDQPKSVGPDWVFFSRYFMRFYVPFNSDTITLSMSAFDKGEGYTLAAVSCNSDGTSYIYALVDSSGESDVLSLGIGHGPDINVGGTLEVQAGPFAVDLVNLGEGSPSNFKVRYDNTTKTIGAYNTDYTVEYGSWTDSDDLVPHGKGYRYFALAGSAGLVDTGVQCTHISAQDDP